MKHSMNSDAKLYIELSLMHCDGIEIYSDIGVASTRSGFKLLMVTI